MIVRILLAALTSIAFSVIFNVKGINILLSGLCSGLGYTVYLLMGQGRPLALFCAGMVITLSAEMVARITKMPATLFLVGGLLPLVPGREMFRMFTTVMAGSTGAAMTHFWNTILQAGALAVGTVIISSLLHLVALIRDAHPPAKPQKK